MRSAPISANFFGKGCWFASCLGNMFSVGCMLEAVRHEFLPGQYCWALAPLCKARIKMWVVLDPDGYECQPIEWRTPLAFAVEHGRSPPVFGALACPTGPPEKCPFSLSLL